MLDELKNVLVTVTIVALNVLGVYKVVVRVLHTCIVN